MEQIILVEQFNFTDTVIITHNGNFLIFHFISVKDIAIGGESSGRRFIEAVNHPVMQHRAVAAANSFNGK